MYLPFFRLAVKQSESSMLISDTPNRLGGVNGESQTLQPGPFIEIIDLSGLLFQQYGNIPLILGLFIRLTGCVKYLRTPHSFIQQFDALSNVIDCIPVKQVFDTLMRFTSFKLFYDFVPLQLSVVNRTVHSLSLTSEGALGSADPVSVQSRPAPEKPHGPDESHPKLGKDGTEAPGRTIPPPPLAPRPRHPCPAHID